MKRSLFVAVFFLLGFSAFAQPKLHPIGWSSNAHNEARTASTIPFLDTLKLPFIHDFSVLYFPIDTIISVPSSQPISITTLRLHGLKSTDTVYVSGVKSPNSSRVNGTKYVKVLSEYTFELYEEATLTTPTTKLADPDTVSYARIRKKGATLSNIPDTLSFYNNDGGAMISPGFAENPISYYTVTFDGLNSLGVPYNTSNPLAVGYTDNLLSQPINLKNNKLADSIYMSFFVEAGGFGEAPNLNDFLYLSFLDSNNVWNEVWSLEGSSVPQTDSFIVFMEGITDSIYFHDAFQFKFESYGRQSGSYDIWNLNYLYIAAHRSIKPVSPVFPLPPLPKLPIGIDHRDYSIAGGDQSILNTYTAMPYDAFFSNQPFFLKDSLYFDVVNQSNDSYGRAYNYTLIDNFGTILYNTPTVTLIPSTILRERNFSSAIPQNSISNINNAPLFINQIYSINDLNTPDFADTNKAIFNPYDFMFNNVLTCGTTLYDYYAYDDNGPEYAFGSTNPGSKVAVEYKAELAGTLTDIDIAFVESNGGNLNGLSIYLMVWDAKRKNELRSQIIAVKYNGAHGFTRYHLDVPLPFATSDTFSIGYQQNFTTLLTLGYDRNNNTSDKIHFTQNGTWKVYGNEPGILTGSLMIHPVFSKGEILTGVEDKPVAHKKQLELYPNPAVDYVHIVSQEELQYKVYSLYGQEIESGILSAEKNTNSIAVQHYVAGMYIIICTDRYNNTYTARFIKE